MSWMELPSKNGEPPYRLSGRQYDVWIGLIRSGRHWLDGRMVDLDALYDLADIGCPIQIREGPEGGWEYRLRHTWPQ